MALDSTSPQGPTTNRLLNKLHYAMTAVADDIGTATTSDILVMLDASDGYEPKYADADNARELIGVTATAAEINNNTDRSARLVAAGGTLSMVEATHEGRIIALDTASGSVVTLPASTGGGAVYKFLVTVTATSNSHIIKVANATDEMRGYVIQDSDTATAPNIWWAADNDDTITLNRTTTGLAAQGEYFEIVDATSGHFFVRGYSQASGTEATPFSATVS